MLRLPLNPGVASFPVFWFPIVAPLFISALGVAGDLINAGMPGGHLTLVELSNSALKNINLAYASTDIWALTTVIFAAASDRLRGWQLWAYTLAAVIALLFHMFAYLFVALMGGGIIGFTMSMLLFLVGSLGMIQMRVVVYQSIEVEDLRRLIAADDETTNSQEIPAPHEIG